MEIEKKYPRLLIVSHNTFSSTLNNGKTYSSIFNGWPKEKIAQLFFQNEIPEFNVCENFYHITDEEMFNISKKLVGKKIQKSDLNSISKSSSPIHSYARKKPMPIFSFFRNIIWLSNKWNNFNLNEWLINFEPEAIFFVGGDTSFSYKITKYIAEKFNIPVYLYYTDDYITPTKSYDPFWWINYLWLKKVLKKLLLNVANIFVIGEDMGSEFSLKLNKKCIPLMNAINIDEYLNKRIDKNIEENTIEIAYFGGLHLNRWKTLLLLGKTLKDFNNEEATKVNLNIYTGQTIDKNIWDTLNENPNINFRGAVTEKEIIEEMQKYDVLLHVESFDKEMISKTRLSISTKIPEYLASGRVILGVGPAELSSIKYLDNLKFPFIVDKLDKDILENKLKEMILQKENFNNIGLKGIKIAKSNHSIEDNKNLIRQIISNGAIK